MKRIILFALAALSVISCGKPAPKMLILYYSQTGATESVATEIQKQTGADMERFDVVDIYDGDFIQTVERIKTERENGYIPELVPLSVDIADYDVIFLGYPVWFGTYAPPVKALFEVVDFKGKKIVPFCTFGSGGLFSSIADMEKALPDSEISEGFGIRNARISCAAQELDRFLIENGWKEGSVDPLPEYSSQEAVTADDAAIYNEATQGYPFPMGEPVSVGSRVVPGGVDYLFTVKSKAFDGSEAEGKVYVSSREGRKAEFTQAVR